MEMMMAVAAVEAVLLADDPTEVEDDDPDDLPPHFGHPQTLPTSHPTRFLEPWQSPSHLEPSAFTTTFMDDVTRSRTIGARPGHFHCHHDQ